MKIKRTIAGIAALAMSLSSLGLTMFTPSADSSDSLLDSVSEYAVYEDSDYDSLADSEESETDSVTDSGEEIADSDSYLPTDDCIEVNLEEGTISTTDGEYGISLASETEDDSDEVTLPYIKYTVTEEELNAAGVAWQGSSKATVYVKMTEGGADSKINASIKLGPDGDDGQPVGKASSKYLSGRNVASGNAIQDNLVGAAGTGIYAFPDVNLNKSMQNSSASWKSEYANEITLTIRIDTADTDCELLGIKFSNGAVYKAVDGFNPSKVTLESTSYDVVATASKDLLKLTLDYCDSMDSSKYQTASWEALQTELEKAKAVYNKAGVSESECKTARASLEKVKANMLFKDTDTESNPMEWHDLTNDEIVAEMGVGTNLGNTMDGHSGFTPSETAWQSTVTTKAYIKALHDAGYNTVRIPVTWGTMIDDDNGYAINEQWISRVQDIVDYCVSQDMYAIINIHHDGAEQSGWLNISAEDIDPIYEKFECVWRNIAEYFKDYDEHLIFESMNEITGGDTNTSAQIEKDTPIIMNLNQIFVNVVRSTGSNNTHRWLASVAHYANIGETSSFSLPTDSYNDVNRLMFAAHIYKSSSNTTFTYDDLKPFISNLQKMAKKYNVPMYLGEYGTVTKKLSGSESGYNDVERAWYSEIVSTACQVAGIVPCVWSQGIGSNGIYETGQYFYWDRENCKPIFKNIDDAIVRGVFLPASAANRKYDFTDIVKDPEIIPITEITLSTESVNIALGDTFTVSAETSPSNANDVVLWSTDDDTVATVYNGKIRAHGVGVTTVHAYNQQGGVEKEITVNVTPAAGVKATEIVCDDTVVIKTNKHTYLNPTVEPAEADSYISYKSSNTDVATVDSLGKVVGVKDGTAYVTLTSASGLVKTVKVIVSDSTVSNEMNLALHVLYNDDTNKYYGCETGTPVTVNGDGTYTVSFDLSTQLSKAGKSAGITEINNLTAIYIKDIDVTNGEQKKSSAVSAKIVYDSVKVNGTELTLNSNNVSTNVINSSGVFDSGKPVNAWDNSVIDEVKAENHVAKFTTVSKPTTVEVTFTLSDVAFREESSDTANEATELKAQSDTKVKFDEAGGSAELTVKLTPADADTKVAFVSADSSIAAVDSTACTVDPETGCLTVKVIAAGEGRTTVTALTENGLKAEFTVIVGDYDEPEDTEEPDEPDDSSSVPDEDTSSADDNSSESDSSDADSSDTENSDVTSSESTSSESEASQADSSSAGTSSAAGTASSTASGTTDSASTTSNPATGAAKALSAAGLILSAMLLVTTKKRS